MGQKKEHNNLIKEHLKKRGISNNKTKLGDAFNHTYAYDDLNRLIKANGKAKSASYEMTMTFGRMSEPLTKVQKVDSTKTAQSYDFTYKYEDSNHPTAPTQIGHEHYIYDANGNPTLVENDSLGTERRIYWDEDNRLMVLSDNGKTSRYTYNATGERIIKSHGDLEGVYINGAPQGITFHETEEYTIYPAPIITVTKNRFTKHYFIGDNRVASKLGVGRFSNVYGISDNNVTAGQKDYAARMMQIEKQREEYYKSLGTPPGVPTMKGATADPDNTGRGYNDIIGDLGDHSVPEGWVQRPKFNEKGDVPGPPVQWQKPEDPDNAQPGYGYVPTDTTNIEDIFFYHSDHLGSTSYITDAKANITQFDAYLPYGELLVDEHTSSEEMPYKFNGKQFDEETGLYYYGARYLNPMDSIWYGVDPMTEKYPNVYSYCFTLNNPIRFIDEYGLEVGDLPTSRSSLLDKETWWGGNVLKGFNFGLNQRYKIEPSRGSTVTGLRDTHIGRISAKTGKPVGEWVIRVDKAHTNSPRPHFNINSKISKLADPHTPIPGGTKTLKALEGTGRVLNSVGKIAKPVAIATDVVRVANAVHQDGETIGKNTMLTSASVAGGWAGAAAGASIGAKGGAAIGGIIGSLFAGVGAAPGAAVGGFVGGIIGSFGGSWLAEEGANHLIK